MSKKEKYLQQLMGARLKRKYGAAQCQRRQPCGLIYQHLINSIVNPKHFLNSHRIGYEEKQIECNKKQFLKRYYYRDQFESKCSALTQYYKYHQNYPWKIDPPICIIMMTYQEAKNKQQRKLIKRLMNEPSSISVTQNCSSEQSSRRGQKQENKNLEFSEKLGQLRNLDSNRSSIMLQQICHTISDALSNVKPLYFYRGIYKDGVKDFKKFLSSKMNKKNNGQPFQKKQKHLNSESEQNKQNQVKTNKNQMAYKGKFDSTRQLRKGFNIVAPEGLRKNQKKKSFSRLTRNRTTTFKPQSFSKTTINQTVSRDDNPDQAIKKRNKSSVRIRKCKSVMKNIGDLHRSKEVPNVLKMPEPQAKRKYADHKLSNTISQLRHNSQLKRQDSLAKTKKQVKKLQPRAMLERVLTRQSSKPSITKQALKQSNILEGKQKQNNALHSLIKAKLNLRG